MTAIDTNILVYATRTDMDLHRQAAALLAGLAEGDEPWALPWPCVYEYLKVVTHPRVFRPPTPIDVALDDIEAVLDSPALIVLGPGPTHRAHWRRMVDEGRAIGNLVHDAHIAALMVEHGVDELLSVDRDFRRFPGINARNPFAPKPRRV